MRRSTTKVVRIVRAKKRVRNYATTPSETGPLKKTVLNQFHKTHGGVMVPYSGWEMPVEYKDQTIGQSHSFTRRSASLFDVSHMGQLRIDGKDRVEFLDKLVVSDVAKLADGKSQLSSFTTPKGGIIDDTMVTAGTDHLYVVINAGCVDKDLSHLNSHLKNFQSSSKDAKITFLSTERSLLALQGPLAASSLQSLIRSHDLGSLHFMHSTVDVTIAGIPNCRVTRCGYTGEDGFEISVPSEHVEKLASKLIENTDVRLAGLGARDSLRLECGLCLYGNDIDENTTPIEAGLSWTVSKLKTKNHVYLGSEVIEQQLRDGVSKKRVGITLKRGVPRGGEAVVGAGPDKKNIGLVTSGGFSPALTKGIAMAYVDSAEFSNGRAVNVVMRGKNFEGTLSELPLVPTSFFKNPLKPEGKKKVKSKTGEAKLPQSP